MSNPGLPCRFPGRAADADEKACRSLQGTQAVPLPPAPPAPLALDGRARRRQGGTM